MKSFEIFHKNKTTQKKKTTRQSTLNDKYIHDKNYEHVLKTLHEFEIKITKEYQYWYVKTDFLLLADVFEEFRKICRGY